MIDTQKTVYFLGAGFSRDAGGPIQNELIQTILSDSFINENRDEYTLEALRSFKKFLRKEMSIGQDQFINVVLEDIFTPIDRCIAEGRTFRKYSSKELVELHEQLHYLLAKAIQYSLSKKNRNEQKYINDFAEYLNNLAKFKKDNIKDDRIAVLTTNWDLLLDNALYNIVKRETNDMCNQNLINGPIAVVDYCCNISSLEQDDYIKPGLLALGRNGYNIKYLKLHGSMNWLHCPNCQRLYVKFEEKTMFNTAYCKHCVKNYKLENKNCEALKLRGNLLLPTFVKDLRNIQLQLIWQNAGIELSEASKIVFIGYSLPYADFEIRQLLSRFIRSDAKIEVVLHPTCAPNEEINRFKNFFGKRHISIIRKTVPEYVKSLS